MGVYDYSIYIPFSLTDYNLIKIWKFSDNQFYFNYTQVWYFEDLYIISTYSWCILRIKTVIYIVHDVAKDGKENDHCESMAESPSVLGVYCGFQLFSGRNPIRSSKDKTWYENFTMSQDV